MRGGAVIAGFALVAGCGFSATLTGDAGGTAPSDGTSTAGDAPPSNQGWWNPAYHHRRRITVTNAYTDERLTSFPVLVSLPAAFDYGHADARGGDLRFVRDDGTLLPYDVDTFSPGNESKIWVATTIVPPPANQPGFWMYYDAPGVQVAASPNNVWASSNVSVHHLTDLSDATGAGHTGTAIGTIAATSGAVGVGMKFDGALGITLAKEPDYDFGAAMSASIWMKLDTPMTKNWEAILTKGDKSWRLHHANGGVDSPVAFSTSEDDNVDNNDNLDSQTLALDVWHHIGVVFAAHKKLLIVDGVAQPLQDWNGPILKTNTEVSIGDNLEQQGRHFVGKLDEVRITSFVRSRSWMICEYQTVTDPQFVMLGEPDPHVN